MMNLAILLLVAVLGLYLVVPGVAKLLLRARFHRLVQESGCICLTFDDGPHPVATPQILTLLETAQIKATFFVLGKQAEQYPELIDLIMRKGHEIGEHGYRHMNAWKTNPFRYAIDLWRGSRWIQPASVQVNLFRPPFGKLNLITLLYLTLERRQLAFWDIDPRDYDQQSPMNVARYVIEHLDPGKVVLLHDGRVRPGDDPAVTVQALKLILEAVAARKLRFTTLSEAFAEQSALATGYHVTRRIQGS